MRWPVVPGLPDAEADSGSTDGDEGSADVETESRDVGRKPKKPSTPEELLAWAEQKKRDVSRLSWSLPCERALILIDSKYTTGTRTAANPPRSPNRRNRSTSLANLRGSRSHTNSTKPIPSFTTVQKVPHSA